MRTVLAISTAALAAALLAVPAAAQPGSAVPWAGSGQLEDGDAQDADEHRYDDHRLRLEAGRRYRITAASDEFDTYIRLFRAGESEPVAENDDADESLNSRVTYTPEQSGDYVLRVLSYSPDGRGAYSASAEALPPLPPPSRAAPSATPTTRWSVWEGSLDRSDADRDGAHFDDYLVTMDAGETRLISVESADFDTMVWVLRTDAREGEPIDLDDDSGSDVNALLAFRPEESGDYIVRVTSYSAGETGGYRLRISDALIPPPPPPLEMADEGEPSHH